MMQKCWHSHIAGSHAKANHVPWPLETEQHSWLTMTQKFAREQIHFRLIHSKSTSRVGGWVMPGSGGWQKLNLTQTTWPEFPPTHLPHNCTRIPSRVWENRCRFYRSSASGKPHLTIIIKKISKAFFIFLIGANSLNCWEFSAPSISLVHLLHQSSWQRTKSSILTECFAGSQYVLFTEKIRKDSPLRKEKLKIRLKLKMNTGSSRKIDPLKIT